MWYYKNRLPVIYLLKLSIQNLFSVSTIIIVISSILQINSSTLFLLNSINNIIYIFLYKSKFPIYLVPNMIFTSPSLYFIFKYGYEYVLNSFFFYGLVFLLIGFLIKKYDFFWLNYIFPPNIIGLLIVVMSLDSSITLINKIDINNSKLFSVFLSTFLVTIFSSIFWNKFLFVPIFIGIIFGYTLSIYLNLINLQLLYNAPWFCLPKVYLPKFNLEVSLVVFPIVFLSLIEYISFIIITEKNYFKKKNNKKNILFKSIFLNGILNMLLSFFGSIPSSFYNESIKLMSIKSNLKKNNINSNLIVYITSIFFIILSFIGKIHILIKLIPIQVVIGITLLIYGIMLSSGLEILSFNLYLNDFKNILLIFTVIIFGVSGFKIIYRNIEIKGLVLSILLSVVLNLLFKFINYLNIKILN